MLVPQCSKQKPGYLKQIPVAHESPVFTTTKQDVTVEARALTKQETINHFGVNIRAYYQPIHLALHNNNNHTLIFRHSYLNIPTAEPKKVAELLHKNTVGRITALVGLGYLGAALFAPLTPLILVAIPVGFLSSSYNKKIDKKIAHISLDVSDTAMVFIPPYGTVNKFIFVPRDEYRSRFDLTLFDAETKEALIVNIVV